MNPMSVSKQHLMYAGANFGFNQVNVNPLVLIFGQNAP